MAGLDAFYWPPHCAACQQAAQYLRERARTVADMLDLMTEEYTFIKRPVLVRGEQALAGFTPNSYERFFGEA